MANSALVKKKEQRAEIARPEQTRNGATYTPRCDILETDDELVLYADLPGVHADGVDVRMENGELEIFGRCTARHEGQSYLTCEYDVGDYYRTFTITEAIDADKITAELKHGVLTVHLPKNEAVKPKRIAVKGE